MEPWEIISLETDYSGQAIGAYFEEELGMKIRRVRNLKKEDLKLDKDDIFKLTSSALKGGLERKLVLYGSGAYHHYTYGLCRHADRLSGNYAYMHFDHHNDHFKHEEIYGEYRGKARISCGAFLADLLKDTNASAVMLIGSNMGSQTPVKNKIYKAITEKHLRAIRGFRRFGRDLSALPEDVYLSFDLDVMTKRCLRSAYDQGTLKPKELFKMIETIKRNKRIISADVLGFAGMLDQTLPGKSLYKDIVLSLLES